MIRARPVTCLVVACWASCLAGADVVDQPGELRFVRVNVPAGSLADVPLGAGRYIPMPTAEFEDAIARLGAARGSFRTVSAVDVRYDLSLDPDGRLAGTVEFELADPAARLPDQIALGRVTAGRCTIRTAAGTGDAAVFCLPDGTAAVRTTGPGSYTCDLRLPGTAVDAAIHLPLMPALATTVDLGLPEGMRPLVSGPTASTTVIEAPAAGRPRWRLALGPTSAGSHIGLWIDGGRRGPPRVRAWNAIDIAGRQARVVARLEPTAPWTSGTLELTVSPGLVVGDVVAEASGARIPWGLTDARLTLAVPASLGGATGGIVVSGVMPAAPGRLAPVPVVEPSAARWSGCNTRLLLDPALAVQRVELDHCRAVSPAAAAAWPVPVIPHAVTGTGIEPARIDLEHESPGGAVRVAFGPRDATLDVARATLVDISSGTVLGKTAVDVRVVAGQAFGVVADVAPGWIVDSVEAVDWAVGSDSGAPGEPAERTLEWRVARSPRGSELRIGLSVAATPRRDLGLRISGHRSGLPLGSEFSSGDMDMVRFAGETAVLEFQLGPTAVLEPIGGTLGVEPVPERLEKLVTTPPPRVRIRAGDRAPAIRARLVRRRPPVEAEVNIDLVARGDRLAENFTFTCRPVAGELDAVVIHFSTAMGSGLEWSAAAGDGTSLAAQPLEAGDATRGELRSEAAVAESWLVELRPATTAAVSFRAFRTVPLETESAVPLAWVEAAERPGGTVTVRGEPGRRPAVFNHQLRELPAVAGADPTVVELAYGSPRSLVAGPVAEVAAPPAMAVPRAWAWKHETTVWCHESGSLEWEASFDVENEGRDAATVTLPRGMSVAGATVAGEAVTATPLGADATALTVPLTRGHGRIRIVIRGAAQRDGRAGWWRIGDVASNIDMPVLEPQTTLMLPPGLDVASAWSPAAARGWPTRLFGAAIDSASGSRSTLGFRPFPLAGQTAREAGPIVFRRDMVASLAILLAAAAIVLMRTLARRSVPVAIAACGAAALVALWCGGPWDALARATLWGGVVGTWGGAGRRRACSAGAVWATLVCGVVTTPVGAAEVEIDPLRVFIAPGDDGGTALVPERLFRRLSAAAASGPPAVRVLTSDVTADVETGLWRVRLALDADRGGSLLLDQTTTAATWWLPSEPRDLTVTIEGEGRGLRVVAPAAGRHELDVGVRPALVRVGAMEIAAVDLPPAPRASVRLAETNLAGNAWQCDQAVGQGAWTPVPMVAAAYDVAAASRVRLVRPADRRDVLANPRTATSVNEIDWREDGCRLTATFEVGGEHKIVRSLGLRADPALVPLPEGVDGVVVSRGEGRYAVELAEPRAGLRRVVIGFRMPLADPVGVFDVPFVWLTDVENDLRTVRLRPAPGLDASPEVPAGVSLSRLRDEDGATVVAWRTEFLATGPERQVSSEPRSRIDVRRRSRPAVAVQDLAVEFADDHVGLRLRARFDASQEPLLEVPLVVPPAAVVERVSLTREPEGDDTDGPRRVDVVWSREAADRIVAVAQRPDRGRFRMQLDARLPIRPASRGPLPIARVASDDMPLEVTCRATAGMVVQLDRPGTVEGDDFELSPGGQAPAYSLVQTPVVEAGASPGGSTADDTDEPAAPPSTMVELAIDERGRAWGLARFDFVADEPVVRLVLPAGMRLFGIRADGRDLTSEPVDAGVWELRLHDVGWPRSLVAVVAGSIGGRFEDGDAIRLEPPRLAGLAATQVLWSIDSPVAFAVRVSEPARRLDPADFASRREALQDAFGDAFERALRRAERPGWESFGPLAAARRSGGPDVGRGGWEGAWPQPATRTLVVAPGDGTVTIRAARAAAGPDPARGAVTAAIVAAVTACWMTARRVPGLAGVGDAVRRWWWAACGIVWLIAMWPPLPGLVMLLIGAWLAATWTSGRIRPSAGDGPADDGPRSTLTFAPD